MSHYTGNSRLFDSFEFMGHPLEAFFSPQHIAVVGASRTPEKVGHIVLANLVHAGFSGVIYPVNPKAEEILGLTSYSSLQACPISPDVVIVAVPAHVVLQVLDDCYQVGCRHVVIFTAGFKEIGETGEKIEEEVARCADKYGIHLLGPNCLGYLHTPANINASFADAPMLPGTLNLLSQSGAVASAFFDRSASTHVGLESCITLGNKTVLGENEFLAYRKDHGVSGPIGLYLESLKDGKIFAELAQEIGKDQPIILLKPGKSQAAQHAMQSHTGSIAGSDSVLQAMCEQSGIIRCESIEAFFDTMLYASRQRGPKGNRVAIISNAGGPGVVATDLLESVQFSVAELPDHIQNLLRTVLPRAASVINPIDVLGDAHADRYQKALEAVIDEPTVDAVLILLTPQEMTEIKETAEIIAHYVRSHEKPVVCAFIGDAHVAEGIQILHRAHVPAYSYPRKAIDVLAKMKGREERRKRRKQSNEIAKKQSNEITNIQTAFKGWHGKDVFLGGKFYTALGGTFPAFLDVTDGLESGDIRKTMNFPVVMKLSHPDLLHKLEVKGVKTNLYTSEMVSHVYQEMRSSVAQLAAQGMLGVKIYLQEQIRGGVELIVGARRDTSFGTVIMFGAGGSLTNLFTNHSLFVLPWSKSLIREKIMCSAVAPLLSGRRGQTKSDIEALVTFLRNFGNRFDQELSIDQCEINPLIANDQGLWIVDPKIVYA